ncbi:hypothetical protein VM1G_11873 [Cytospora mali]|uniref:Uncharacterized protein n=1 Tax=Cytospora mali TaxID=578113 RepID=A0A194W9L0_CYTMA|nr:hypothetical protein VM1G_11873 [Valsa mali]
MPKATLSTLKISAVCFLASFAAGDDVDTLAVVVPALLPTLVSDVVDTIFVVLLPTLVDTLVGTSEVPVVTLVPELCIVGVASGELAAH